MDDPHLVEDEAVMHRPIVHIGYHKTATTWFQRKFYPRVTNRRYVPQIDVMRAFKAYDMLSPDDAALRNALGGSDTERPAIVCDETLCGSFREPYMRGMLGWATAEVLARVMPDADIVIFLRSQPDMLAATYAEYVRGGGTGTAADLFALAGAPNGNSLRAATIATPDLAHFEYDRLIARYDAIFGADRVHVFLYEDFRWDPPGFLRAFVGHLALDVSLDGLDLSRENVSYRRGVIALARLLNRIGQGEGGRAVPLNIPGMFRYSRSLLYRLNRLPAFGRPPTVAELFGADALGELERRFAPSNRRLNAARDLALAENGYPV